MEQVKTIVGELSMKIKLLVGLLIAGLAVGAVAWREHVKAGMAAVEQKAKEEAAKEEAAKKLAAETAKLEAEKKEKEAKLEAEKKQLKEISLSLNIADHDLGIKAKKALEFLEGGDKVKLSLLMKGRQMAMKASGEIVMLKFAHFVEELGIPEALPKLEGNRWNMIIKPKKK